MTDIGSLLIETNLYNLVFVVDYLFVMHGKGAG